MPDVDDPAVEEDENEPDEDDDVEAELAPIGQVEQSLDAMVSKQAQDEPEDDEDESLLTLTREERLETLSIKAAPKQANEFVCGNCHLVKHQSQLADAKRQLCRDCV